MILEKLKAFIEAHNLSDSKIAIGCSGGVDSLSLLDALVKVHAKELIYCTHLDHGWQTSSYKAFELVKGFCDSNGITLLHKSLKAGEIKISEEEGRKKRYEFFAEVCKEKQIPILFLAHNANDQAETILFRIFRGTSTAGLQGIPESRELEPGITIYRPFLEIKREEIESYAKESRLEFYEDQSNKDVNFARNRIRHEILTEANQINAQATENINQLSTLVKEEKEFLDLCVSKAIEDLGALPWQLEKFRLIHRAIQRKILEKVFTPNIEFVSDFLEAIQAGGFHRINFKKDKFFAIKQKQIWLE